MSERSGVRSSARLSGEAAAPAAGRGARGRPPSASAAAALRRARAAARAAEVEDSPRVLRDKCRRLARALRNAKHLVVYTGAGISTAADIPDYRGPHGVWTRLQRGETVGRVEVARAQPTFTHMALTALWARGALKFVASQNCDGLHLRAGLPRRALAELHGDMFAELCAACRRVYLRAFDTTQRTARHAHGTRRLCHACGAELTDSIVHFGERGRAAWPLNWAGALRHAARADVVLCLGSSLKVLRRYPRLWRMQSAPRDRPALYIVNLQWTPKDAVAALKINARCDAVMRQVARRLRLRVPRYRASRDPVLAHAEPLAAPEAHTSRRPALLPCAFHAAPASDPSTPSSPSASDSDEELPLRRLAARLRGHSPLPYGQRCGVSSPDRMCGASSPDRMCGASSPDRMCGASSPDRMCGASSPDRMCGASSPDRMCVASSPDRMCVASSPDQMYGASTPDRLHAFQVSMHSGEATILLRAEHALKPESPGTSPVSLRCRTADLRRFRMTKHLPDAPFTVNGHGPPGVAADTRPSSSTSDGIANGTVGLGSRLRRLLEYEPRIDAVKNAKTTAAVLRPKLDVDVKWPKMELKSEPMQPAKEEASAPDAGAVSLAAAIIRRAVLLCRASLYPGLHTIIAPPPPPECAWCARHFAARRCLWYGPARATPLAARKWRRAHGRRYLCACCGARGSPPPPPEPGADDGGWYGKGYRKGRRRRR